MPSLDQSKMLSEVVKIVKELAQRIRLIEERISKIEESVNDLNTKIHEEIRMLNEYKQETSSRLERLEIESTNHALNLKTIEKKLKEYARKSELREIKEYIELLRPIQKVYVTRKELEQIFKKWKREGKI